MKKKQIYLLLIAAMAASPVIVQPEMHAQTGSGTRAMTLPEITRGHFSPRSAGQAFRSTPDGKHYTVLNGDHSAIVRYSYETGQPVDTLFNCKTARECDFDNIQDYMISDNGFHMVLLRDKRYIYRRSYTAQAYHYDVRRNMVSPLSESGEPVRIPTLSPDGRMCAFVRNNDIYIKKFDFNTEVRVTNDGKINAILNGVTDWVYEEELYTIGLMEWSTQGDFLAFVRSDESGVKTIDMTIFGTGNYPTTYAYKYPKAGEKNSLITLKLYNVDNRETKELPLPEQGEYYIPRLHFQGDRLYVSTLNRHQSIFHVYEINPKSMVTKLWLEDKDDRYIDTEWVRQLTFTGNGALLVSETEGHADIYRHSAEGSRVANLTASQEGEVTALYGETPNGEVIYQVAYPTPMDRTIYALDKKGKMRLLSHESGTSNAVFSSDFSYYLLSHSSANEVPTYEIRRTRDAKVITTLEDNQALKERLADYRVASKEFMKLKVNTGVELNGWIIKPDHFDPSRQYPVIMTQYSGPGSQEALNRFGIGWEQALANEGFIVACFDGRGTGARGNEFKKATYLRMGILESDDQIATAQALAQLPYVDGSRIGIFGWSFGGYNVLMCMTRGKGTFKAGVAVAPPTDWGLYDTIYTERYMRTPQENPKGYKETNVMTYVDGLQGELLIVQGTADDNVHMQNVMHLTEALIAADKDYRMMVYTDKNHSIYGGNTRNHLYRNIINHFKAYLQ